MNFEMIVLKWRLWERWYGAEMEGIKELGRPKGNGEGVKGILLAEGIKILGETGVGEGGGLPENRKTAHS